MEIQYTRVSELRPYPNNARCSRASGLRSLRNGCSRRS
jgi:hypothetical protein